MCVAFVDAVMWLVTMTIRDTYGSIIIKQRELEKVDVTSQDGLHSSS